MKTRILKIFKNLTLMLLMSIILSCGPWAKVQMNEIVDKFPIGTSEAYFKKNLSSSKRVLESAAINGRTVYRVTIKNVWSPGFEPTEYVTRFFYFKNGVLVEINEGVRYDQRIKIDKNTN